MGSTVVDNRKTQKIPTMKFTSIIFAVISITATTAFSPQNAGSFRTNTVELNAAVTVGMIKEMRGLTGSGGDIEAAIENMRTSGVLKAAKKATKVAAEGLIIIKSSGDNAALVEVNCQTDFVTKDGTFQSFANDVGDAALSDKPEIAELKAKFEEARVALVAKIGENIDIRRVQYVEGSQLTSYCHNGGNIGVVVAGSGEENVLKDVCMHVCASSPQFLSPDDVAADVVEKERAVQLEIAVQA